MTLRGKVEDASGSSGQFLVECTNVDLQSSTINLNALVGSQTVITGAWNGSSTSPLVQVTEIGIVTETFEIGGSSKIGENAIFSITGSPTSVFAMYSSAGTFFQPFRNAGAVMLDPGTLHQVAFGVIGSEGNFQVKVPIPNNPDLIGITVYGQGVKSPGVGSYFLTNADCMTVEP